METTFITIHDLTSDAVILYASDSIVDVLGHNPDEVVGKPTWDFFSQADMAEAKKLHDRSVTMDKASVLTYCDIKNREGQLVRCECCFSIVYDVMVACTSVYRTDASGINRRADAPIVRRLFSSSPKDPRYHMLQHLSAKFSQNATDQTHEPRAALFLNRFTRTLTIMYATSGINEIIGISGEEMKGRSFYYCIAESCLEDAIKCLESAKSNDSIASLRFMFRDPRQDDQPLEDTTSPDETDEEMTDVGASESEVETGIHESTSADPRALPPPDITSPSTAETSSTSASGSIELEAVVSCTSDGLVVCLRRARPIVPAAIQNTTSGSNNAGFFAAAPWAPQPAFYPQVPPALGGTFAGIPPAYGGPTFAPPAAGPDPQAFLQAIREVAVFAWGLVGINGSLVDYARGTPAVDAQPHDGFPIWDPTYDDHSSSGRGSAMTDVVPHF